jgi:hypothetical protein
VSARYQWRAKALKAAEARSSSFSTRISRKFNGIYTVFGQTQEGLDVSRVVEQDDVVLSIRVWH